MWVTRLVSPKGSKEANARGRAPRLLVSYRYLIKGMAMSILMVGDGMVPPSEQICNHCQWRHAVAKTYMSFKWRHIYNLKYGLNSLELLCCFFHLLCNMDTFDSNELLKQHYSFLNYKVKKQIWIRILQETAQDHNTAHWSFQGYCLLI